MGYVTTFGDFIFVEGSENHIKDCGPVACDMSFKIGAQLKNLNDVKVVLRDKALALGANAVIGFEYGQKSRWLAIDDVAFWGKGQAVVLPPETVERIRETVAKRG